MNLFEFSAKLEKENETLKKQVKELERRVNAYKKLNESLEKENEELKKKIGVKEEIVSF